MRRAAGYQQGEGCRESEAGDVCSRPGQIGRRHLGDARSGELAALAIDGVAAVARGIGVGMRAAARDARPLRPVAARQELEVAAAAMRGLQIVDALEAA